MALDDYRWAVGHDVALGSLIQISNQLLPYNRRQAGWARHLVGIQSPPLDEFPERERTLAGFVLGDGMVDSRLTMVLGALAVAFVEDFFFAGGTVEYAAGTFYLRRHVRGQTYVRRNGYITLPSERNGTLNYLRQGVFRVTYELTDLTEPA
jgi:hypothetical protein